MSSVSDFSPLRYRPTDPNMGRWAWKQDSGNHSIHWMAERDRTPVASITKQPSGCWKIDLTAESSPWLHAAAPKALSPSQPGPERRPPGPSGRRQRRRTRPSRTGNIRRRRPRPGPHTTGFHTGADQEYQ